MLLQVQPEARPCCGTLFTLTLNFFIDQILAHTIISKKIDNFKQKIEDSNDILLQTIKVPKNILLLSDRLPQSNYAKLGVKARKNNRSQDALLPELANRISPIKKRNDVENQSPVSLDKVEKVSKKHRVEGTPIKQQNVNIHLIEKSVLLPDISGGNRGSSPKKDKSDNKNHKAYNNNDYLNQIYQIYVPYKNKQYIGNNYGRYVVPNEKSTHIKNIEKYYNIHNIRPQKLDSRKILNRKLSPIKRAVMNV